MGRFLDVSELEAEVFSEETASDESMEELELELKDGETMICEIVSVFACEDREYMVLHPKEDEEGIVYLMHMAEGENDELKLSPIEDEEELQKISEAFQEIYENGKGNEDYDRDENS